MPRKKRSAKLAVLLFILICAGLAYYIHNQGGLPFAEKQNKNTQETIAAASPATSPTGQQRQTESYTVGKYGQTFTYAGQPVPTTYPNSITVLENKAYLVGYDDTRENPAWVAYRIPARTLTEKFPRPARFLTDTRTHAHVTHEDYTKTGYDRGHMAPNHAIASRFGAEAQNETFLMTNVVPQRPELNQGPWRALEETVASITAPAANEVWVITGPIYSEPSAALASGVVIPSAFYKIVVDETPSGPRTQSFIIPQTVSRRDDFKSFQCSIDLIEGKTGLDFMHDLPDATEDALEANSGEYWLSSAVN